MSRGPTVGVVGDVAATSRPRDAGSLTIALLVTLLALSTSALLVPVIVNQAVQTRSLAERGNSIAAARAGLAVALTKIHNSAAVISHLPCIPITGSTDTDTKAYYQVSIAYFSTNPVGQSGAWLTQNAIACPTAVPAYARLTSIGTARPISNVGIVTGRTLIAVYTFHTSEVWGPGGRIKVASTGGQALCMDAGSATPGAALYTKLCEFTGNPAQTFFYDKNLNIVLVSSQSSTAPAGMCVQGSTQVGTQVTLQPCASPQKSSQQWAFNQNANFIEASDGINVNAFCLKSSGPNASDTPVTIGSGSECNKGTGDTTHIDDWAPDSTVGAGAAGTVAGQLVNYAQFSRCLDAGSAIPTGTYAVAASCDQVPAPNVRPSWEQQWTIPATGTPGPITIRGTDGYNYCLRSPAIVYKPTTVQAYVDVPRCPTNPLTSTNFIWTMQANTGSRRTSYRVKDNSGFCLATIDPKIADYWHNDGTNISKIVVADCGSSALQKWNAAPSVIAPPLNYFGEK